MRDIVLSLTIVALMVATLRAPVVGAYLWAWLSLMNPHKLTYGFAFSIPWAYGAALLTLAALAVTRQRQAVPLNAVTSLLVALLLWMSFTSLFAMAPRDLVLERWIFVMKVQLMLFVTWMLVIDAKHLRTLVWVVTLSVAFYGIKGGVWTVMTGGGGRVWGPPGGMLEGNNELAVGLVMLLPMMHFLRTTSPHRWLRWVLLGAMASMCFSVLGSQSRGALVGLLAMAFFLGLKSSRPVLTSLLLLVFVGAAVSFMPESWTGRMESIGAYQSDGSAMSRVWTWTTLWNAAVDRPLIGVGFAADNAAVFARYAPTDAQYAMFQGQVFVAHSIWFQVLGEHGFVGLALFVALGLATWLKAGSIARMTRDDAELGAWMPLLMRMVQVSLIGYAAGGSFLSLAYLDLPYYIVGFVVTADVLARRRALARTALPLPPAGGAAGAGPGAARDASAQAGAASPRLPGPARPSPGLPWPPSNGHRP